MGMGVQNADFLLLLTFLALSYEILDLFGRWHFQAIGRTKLG